MQEKLIQANQIKKEENKTIAEDRIACVAILSAESKVSLVKSLAVRSTHKISYMAICNQVTSRNKNLKIQYLLTGNT
jgi:hypothetical protein